jgi:enoyl-CoA hydratase/carnithine racemase
MPEPTFVRVERSDGVATVTIDRQEKLNALNPDVIRDLGVAFDGLRYDDEVRGVILTGAGEKAFVAGADITVLAEMTPTSAPTRSASRAWPRICPSPTTIESRPEATWKRWDTAPSS